MRIYNLRDAAVLINKPPTKSGETSVRRYFLATQAAAAAVGYAFDSRGRAYVDADRFDMAVAQWFSERAGANWRAGNLAGWNTAGVKRSDARAVHADTMGNREGAAPGTVTLHAK